METNNRVGLTVGEPVSRRYSRRVSATTGLTTRVGNDYRTVGVAWQVVM